MPRSASAAAMPLLRRLWELSGHPLPKAVFHSVLL